MLLLEYARKRIETVLHEVDSLKESEFPYPQSREALEQLERLFRLRLAEVGSFDQESDRTVVNQACALALDSLVVYLPLLGFILRSTNVRNAFEVYRPLLRLARRVLGAAAAGSGQRTRVILSSEWQYSPIAYAEIPYLPGFVLIGLPAPESGNPLLVPLSGHELGHSVWSRNHCEVEVSPIIRDQVVDSIHAQWDKYAEAFPALGIAPADLTTDLFALETWSKARQWAIKQAEETFCDCIAIRLFGLSYLHAFAYLLAPKSSGTRRATYPNLRTRADNLVKAADEYGMKPPEGYALLFEDRDEPSLTAGDEFQLSVADQVLPVVVDSLVVKAAQLVPEDVAAKASQDEIGRILAAFRHVVPAEGVKGLADILNAAWLAFHDPGFWADVAHVRDSKDAVLRDLVLKNIEVLEIEQIQGEGA